MQQRLRQRMIGAIVLVALGVIFIPMLLTGPVDHKRVDVPIEIPPRPEVSEAPQLPGNGFTEQPQPGRELTTAPRPLEEATDTAADAVPGEEADTGSESGGEAVARDGTGSNGGQNAAETREPTAGEAEPATDTASEPDAGAEDELASWVVQVGSFRNQENANGLRDRLRGQGFSVYVDRTEWEGSALFRVRVGPVIQRDEARELAGELQNGHDLEGIVMQR